MFLAWMFPWRQSHYYGAAIVAPPWGLQCSPRQIDLNDIDSRINFLHEILSAGACYPPTPPPRPTQVLNNYIRFQRLIWLRAILFIPYGHSCFLMFNIGIGKWKWPLGWRHYLHLWLLKCSSRVCGLCGCRVNDAVSDVCHLQEERPFHRVTLTDL